MTGEIPIRVSGKDGDSPLSLPELVEDLAHEVDGHFRALDGLEEEELWAERLIIARKAIGQLSQLFPETRNKIFYFEWHYDPKKDLRNSLSIPVDKTWVEITSIDGENGRCYFVDGTSARVRRVARYPAENVTCFLLLKEK